MDIHHQDVFISQDRPLEAEVRPPIAGYYWSLHLRCKGEYSRISFYFTTLDEIVNLRTEIADAIDRDLILEASKEGKTQVRCEE